MVTCFSIGVTSTNSIELVCLRCTIPSYSAAALVLIIYPSGARDLVSLISLPKTMTPVIVSVKNHHVIVANMRGEPHE